MRLTVIEVDLVASTCHDSSVVAQGQLAEIGQTGSPHPHLELLIGVQRGQGEAGIVCWIAQTPIGWRADLVLSIGSCLVEILVVGPSDTGIGHEVGSVGVVGARGVECDGAEESVVEERVGNETTWVDSLAGFRVDLEWITIAAGDGGVAAEIAHQLVLIVRLDVSSMVLVEVGELIVEEDGRANVVGNVELQHADVGRDLGLAIGAVRDGG